MARKELIELNAHKRTDALKRRQAIRRILATEHHETVAAIRDRLAEEGYDQAEVTVRFDLRDMGAVKVQRVSEPGEYVWIIPAYNPALEQLRAEMNQDQIAYEVELKMSAHAIDVFTVHNKVHVLTEPRAGYLVSYWISWLTWDDIIHVQEQLDSCIIHCRSDEDALLVARRLIGG